MYMRAVDSVWVEQYPRGSKEGRYAATCTWLAKREMVVLGHACGRYLR